MVTMATTTQRAIRIRRNALRHPFRNSRPASWISSAASRRASAIGSMPSPGWGLRIETGDPR
jgi:hypothetical protein